jgi:hypothetical protein
MSTKAKREAWPTAETIKDCGTWTHPSTVGLTVAECEDAVRTGWLVRGETASGPVFKGSA